VLLQLTVQGGDYFVVEQAGNPSYNFRQNPVKNTKSSDFNVDVPVEKESGADAEFILKHKLICCA
jgi:hypothetical protein